MKKTRFNAYNLSFMGVMIAIIYVVTMFRFPFLRSKVHFANAMCLLSGMLFGPLYGAVSAGLGSAIYDLFNGYDFIEALITFTNKAAMAWVCAMITWRGKGYVQSTVRTCIGCVLGALTYVALYMLKTFVYQAFVYAFPMDAVWATMLSKFIPSLINAVFAMIAAPLLMGAIYPVLRATGLLKVIQVEKKQPVEKKKVVDKEQVTVKCPYCQSTDTYKLKFYHRFFDISLTGLFSSKIAKQWHCNKCNSDF